MKSPKTKRVRKGKNYYQLLGIAKLLDNLWDGSYYSMGEKAVERLNRELIYYFGKNWATDMYKILDENGTKLAPTLKDITPTRRKK